MTDDRAALITTTLDLCACEAMRDTYRMMWQLAMEGQRERDTRIAALERANTGLREDLRATYERMMS